MKTKKLFLMAAMLLTSMFAFAQGENNEPLKGDVNGDGKVDVADITAIIAIIMNNTSQTTYYWYVGLTQPTISTDPSQNTTTNNSDANKWHIIGTSLGTYSAANPLYKGSLTTIPCSENVNWIVFKDVKTMSYEQYKNFKDWVEESEPYYYRNGYGNARGPKRLNGRTIYLENEKGLESSKNNFLVISMVSIWIYLLLILY